MSIRIRFDDAIDLDEVLAIYRANRWSSADKPEKLMAALRDSETLVTARSDGELVGLANAISDGHLVVYFPHVLVHPEHQGEGVGKMLMEAMMERYEGFHQRCLISDFDAVAFYQRLGFTRSADMVPMWIYEGDDY
ncbi:MAG: GNAT family N-acetyltransferase [Longimicrobiales bacterium]|nr:GNAT family N-acetyltransferase [Longimicrobiales bacterium]